MVRCVACSELLEGKNHRCSEEFEEASRLAQLMAQDETCLCLPVLCKAVRLHNGLAMLELEHA